MGVGGDLMQVGGRGGEKVAAECCLCPRVLGECLFVSINKDSGGANGGQLFTTKVAEGGTRIHTHTHTDTHDIVPLSFQAIFQLPPRLSDSGDLRSVCP